ncbi:inositol monophosphatase 3 [Oratosquilla oratoria]|uniref:inositol monophosphatase 3 n=1 Tax=Oratosquilla oratoria TaxID=337810 RepID=UPI003F7749B2
MTQSPTKTTVYIFDDGKAREKFHIMNLGGAVRVNKFGVGIILSCFLLLVILYNRKTQSSYDENSLVDDEGTVSLKDLLNAAINAAERGGEQVKAAREEADLNIKSKGKTKEGVNDPLTDGDMKSHFAMFYSLKKSLPEAEIISEEHDTGEVDSTNIISASGMRDKSVEEVVKQDERVQLSDIQVWIDPLDATKEYTENLLQYVTTMVCVAVRGYPTIGVIHKPFEKLTVWGLVGKGVSPSLSVVSKREGPANDVADIIVSLSHSGSVEEVAKAAFGGKTNIIKAGGAGYKTLEVIKGDADAYVHVTLIKKWDLCAGNAILNALNGNMTTLDGNPIDYSSRKAYKNEGGLLATLYNHKVYLEKMKGVKN